jgi:hypothetical protein
VPTSFVGDNIIYKYLDSNIFAVSVLDNVNSRLNLFLINGVSGKLIYKFYEENVLTSLPIDMVITEN